MKSSFSDHYNVVSVKNISSSWLQQLSHCHKLEDYILFFSISYYVYQENKSSSSLSRGNGGVWIHMSNI